jgi:hypothetical protein
MGGGALGFSQQFRELCKVKSGGSCPNALENAAGTMNTLRLKHKNGRINENYRVFRNDGVISDLHEQTAA